MHAYVNCMYADDPSLLDPLPPERESKASLIKLASAPATHTLYERRPTACRLLSPQVDAVPPGRGF